MGAEEIPVVARDVERACVAVILFASVLPDEKDRGAGTILPARDDVRVERFLVESPGVGAATEWSKA